MSEFKSVTDIDGVIEYAERESDGYYKMVSVYHTDEGVYIQEETRFRYKAELWEQISEWLKELKVLREQKRPHGEWIPCSERLPRYNKYVLVYRPQMEIKIIVDCYEGRYGEDAYLGDWHEGWTYSKNDAVIAWMPLPEPYKKEGDEK